FGPAFTWQCTQVRLQSLPTLTCKISGRPRRSKSERSTSVCANRFIVTSSNCRCGNTREIHITLLRGVQKNTRTRVRRLFPWKSAVQREEGCCSARHIETTSVN